MGQLGYESENLEPRCNHCEMLSAATKANTGGSSGRKKLQGESSFELGLVRFAGTSKTGI